MHLFKEGKYAKSLYRSMMLYSLLLHLITLIDCMHVCMYVYVWYVCVRVCVHDIECAHVYLMQ